MFVDWLKVGFISAFLFIFTVCASHASIPATRDALIEMNTAPVGVVDVAGASAAPKAAAALSGAERYKVSCSACHDTGAAGAPQLTAKASWVARIAQGEDTLVKHAIQGYNAMPAKGMCTTCSDDEIKAAVEYMLSKVK